MRTRRAREAIFHTAVVTETANMAYVTGSRTTNAGVSFRQAYQQRNHFINHSLEYTFRGTTPVQLSEWISPFHSETRQHAAGLYVQQQWTTGRLTVDGGLRYDYFRGYIPAMTLEGGRFLPQGASFPAVDNALNFSDLSPRLGCGVRPVRQRQDRGQGVARPVREHHFESGHQLPQPGAGAPDGHQHDAQLDGQQRQLHSGLRSDEPEPERRVRGGVEPQFRIDRCGDDVCR